MKTKIITTFTKFTMALVCTLFMASIVQPANADSFVFELTLGNSAISGFPGPYATVVVDRMSTTTATIRFTSLLNGGHIYLFGADGAVGVNVNATAFTLGPITGSNAGTGFSPGPFSDGGSGNEDGWGSFNQTINSFGGYTHASDTLSFSLTNNSGTWSTAANVLAPNNNGFLAAAHIFVADFPADASSGALATGFATNGAIPEPGTIGLVALGAVGLLAMRKRLSV